MIEIPLILLIYMDSYGMVGRGSCLLSQNKNVGLWQDNSSTELRIVDMGGIHESSLNNTFQNKKSPESATITSHS